MFLGSLSKMDKLLSFFYHIPPMPTVKKISILEIMRNSQKGRDYVEVDVKKVMEHLNEIYQCGAKPDGAFTRMAYSREDKKGREVFCGYFEKLGIPTRVDQAGNLIARMEVQTRLFRRLWSAPIWIRCRMAGSTTERSDAWEDLPCVRH